ncbi:hypothetical protein MKX03_027785, partial [Papaver bracteatum]
MGLKKICFCLFIGYVATTSQTSHQARIVEADKQLNNEGWTRSSVHERLSFEKDVSPEI